MADTRLNLDKELRALLGTSNVYFQPPESIKLKYPCFIYNLSSVPSIYANDRVYKSHRRYQVTYVTSDPDTQMIDDFLAAFQLVGFDRHFAADRLNHYIFTLYY